MDQPPAGPGLADQLLTQLDQGHPAAQADDPPPNLPVKRPNYSHDALIDLMITRPDLTQNQIAKMIGYTPCWVSTMQASDAFQARYAERLKTLVDPVARVTIEERFKVMALRSSEILLEKLNQPAALVPDQLALQALAISSKASGYGIKQPLAPIDVAGALDRMGQNLVNLLREKRQEASIPGDFHDITPHAQAT